VLAAVALLALAAVVTLSGQEAASAQPASTELLLKVDLEPHEPYSPPPNMYLWWGPSTNHRFVGSGEHIRHLLHLGQIEGGEWRDPMFLGNNGVATFRSQRFRRISETCCSTIVIPPMEWDFPVYNIHKIIGQRIRNFVANGNMLVLTGGILAVEFINSYFFYNIELADGNYSPGPYRRLKDVPECLLTAPQVLPQKGIAVTAVKKESLPSGTEVLWGTPRSTPVFMIKFCEAQSPSEGMPPIKVLPRDCPAAEKDGRPCSCGYIMYIGYNYQEQYPTRWDKVLRGAVEIMSPVYEAPAGGYKIPKKKVIPGIPPCLEKYGDKKTKWTRDKSPKVSTLSGDADSKPVRPERAARGRSMALAKADQKLQLQQQEINALEKQVQALSEQKERSVIKKARQQSLSQLRTRAAHLLHEVKEREAAKRPHGSTEKVLLHSVSALTKDIKSVNSKVDHLASVVQKKNEDDVFGQE
jgi:hypothetical protein